MSFLARLASPAFYTGAWSNMIAKYTPMVRQGSFVPAMHLMMAVGTIGYTVEVSLLFDRDLV